MMWILQQHDNGLYDPESPFGYLLPAHMQMTLLFRLLRNADDSSWSALLQDANLEPIPMRPVKANSIYSKRWEIWLVLVSCPNSVLFPGVARDANMRH